MKFSNNNLSLPIMDQKRLKSYIIQTKTFEKNTLNIIFYYATKIHLLLTLYSLLYPSLTHSGHSQLLGRSSLTIPSASSYFGTEKCYQFGARLLWQVDNLTQIYKNLLITGKPPRIHTSFNPMDPDASLLYCGPKYEY